MEQKLTEQISTLLSQINARDAAYRDHNQGLAELIAPTYLTAVVEVLNLPNESMEFVDITIVDTYLVLIVNVTYNPSAVDLSPLLADEDSAPEAVEVQKTMRIGVPIKMVFQDASVIRDFLLSVAPKQNNKPEAPKPDGSEVKVAKTVNEQFDAKSLTRDQINQMLYFQHTTAWTKQ